MCNMSNWFLKQLLANNDFILDAFDETLHPRDGLGRFIRKFHAIRTSWQDDFPDTIIDRKLGDATSHPGYLLAKSGDVESAFRLAKDLITDNAIAKLAHLIDDREVVFAPVHAEESLGRNMIPLATAHILSRRLNCLIDTSIVQATKVSRTGGNGWHRLAFPPKFDGNITGKYVIMVDDTQTQGGTFAAFKGHIEQSSSVVIGAYALTGKQYSSQLRLSTETLNELRINYGTIENFWYELFGYDFSKLTEWEARFIINSRKRADEVRDTILATKQN